MPDIYLLNSTFNIFSRREGIFPDFRLGTSWFQVPGLDSCVSLCASDSAVYALTGSGRVFRRTKISERNFIGDAWEDVPLSNGSGGGLTAVSVSVCNQVKKRGFLKVIDVVIEVSFFSFMV